MKTLRATPSFLVLDLVTFTSGVAQKARRTPAHTVLSSGGAPTNQYQRRLSKDKK
jgi:hypothetical protein